jgi:SAM-dependent methyltransferase
VSIFGCLIFLGSFLLFLVQPMIAKQILPWFGGSAAVWATCLVFFQTALLAGYAYADWTSRFLRPKRQAVLHIVLLGASLLLLPIIPNVHWKPSGGENPSLRILGLLAVTVGLPYLLLATTSPLVQTWFVRRYRQATPYRLFALSNLASLLALVSFPFAVEPWIASTVQLKIWSALFAAFVLLCAGTAYLGARGNLGVESEHAEESASSPPAPPPAASRQLLWLALAAMSSFMLLAVTNHICRDVAAIPFLWIAPLALYLLSFILCFDHPRWYARPVFLALTAMALPALAWFSDSLNLRTILFFFGLGLFVTCMFCHGELSRLRPDPRHLTTYYLMIAIGGALGGILVGFGAPYLLPGYFELQIGLVACGLLLLLRTRSFGWWATIVSIAVMGATGWISKNAIDYQLSGTKVMMRNFYTALRIYEAKYPVPWRSLVHGGIMHGGELLDPGMHLRPTGYYGPTCGVARMLSALPLSPRRVGVIGLGPGGIAAFARKGDVFRFYEIDPQVIDLAYKQFYFLTESPAKIEVELGDGRLLLEREPSQHFDVLVMDAFSGESIPVHMLTREAMATFMRHLKPGGVLAFQATNRYVDIEPVIASLAEEYGLTAVLVSDFVGEGEGANYWLCGTDQILMTSNKALLDNEAIRSVARPVKPRPGFRIWTDDFSNLFDVLAIAHPRH